MNLTRVTSTLGAGAVAAIAAWSSWSHMVHVALKFGERPEVAYALPLSVDGLLVVASAAMVDDKRSGRAPRTSAKIAFAVGVVASLAANVAAAEATLGARVVAGWPALALLLTVELLSRRGKQITDAEPAAPEPVAEPEPLDPWRFAEPVATPEPVAEPVRKPSREPVRRGPAPRSLTSADKVMAAHLSEPDATHARIAELSGVSLATVKRWRPKRSDGSPSPADAAATPINGRPADLTGVTA